jgi:PleD family two-component response regulator
MSSHPNRLLWFIIDDDIDDQEIFTISARKVDPAIECEFANDGVDAIEKLSDIAFTPGCIFLDVNMPRMNGIECLEELGKIARLSSVPVFMCSTSSDTKIVAKIKELGAYDFIVKPSTISEFTAILAEVKKSLK